MMTPIDINRVYLQLGLSHPVFGPTLLAYYSAIVGPVVAYGWYVEWVKLFTEMTYDKVKSQAPRP